MTILEIVGEPCGQYNHRAIVKPNDLEKNKTLEKKKVTYFLGVAVPSAKEIKFTRDDSRLCILSVVNAAVRRCDLDIRSL